MKIFKINIITYYLLAIYFTCGYIKIGLIIFLIIIVHELGHITAAKILKFEIIKCDIYPFGGVTKLKKDINTSLIKEFFLSISGVLGQIILYIIIKEIFLNSYISIKDYNIFLKYNQTIIFFNLLPIIPLDGSYISEIFLNKFISYKKSLYINVIISVIFLNFLIYYMYTQNTFNYMIASFLIYKIYENLKNHKKIFNKFLLERHLYNYDFRYLNKSKKINLKILKKNTQTYFYKNKCWVSEKSILKNFFTKTNNNE